MSCKQFSGFQCHLCASFSIRPPLWMELDFVLSEGSVPRIVWLLPVSSASRHFSFVCPCFENSLVILPSAFHFPKSFSIIFLFFHSLSSCEFISSSYLVSFSGGNAVKHMIIIHHLMLKILNHELLRFGLSIWIHGCLVHWRRVNLVTLGWIPSTILFSFIQRLLLSLSKLN